MQPYQHTDVTATAYKTDGACILGPRARIAVVFQWSVYPRIMRKWGRRFRFIGCSLSVLVGRFIIALRVAPTFHPVPAYSIPVGIVRTMACLGFQ